MMPLIAGVVLALVLSALFTAAELAIFSLPESRLRSLVDSDAQGSRSLLELRARPERLLVLLRLGSTTSTAAVVALLAYAGLRIDGAPGLAVGAGGAALVVLILGVLIPLRLTGADSAGVALALAGPILFLRRATAPLLVVIEKSSHAAGDGHGFPVETLNDAELRQLTAFGHADMEEHERQIIERALRLDETKAWDIMTPRVDIFAWSDSLTLSAIASQLGSVSYSRVPIFGESIDDITGVLHVRDAYQALVAGQRDVPLRALARQPLIVPGSVPLSTLLGDFQTRRIHMAVVVDEYGGTDGLVTLEDVIEELVGEIVDETDVTEESLTRISRHEVVAAGDADLREINHYFNTAFPLLEHRSLNGYLLEELGHVPSAGEAVDREGLHIEVLEATETQVMRARLRRLAQPEATVTVPAEPVEVADPALGQERPGPA